MNNVWKKGLSLLLGEDKVSTNPEVLKEYSHDKWNASHLPDAVVFAECTEDVSYLMGFANSREIPVTTRGAGVGYVGGCVPVKGGIVLSMERMNKILEVNPADGVAVVQPGVITGDLQAKAKELGWFYPPDPASLKECSMGGNIATNAGGPRCLKYGVTRQYVMGLEVVLADGKVMRCGGRTHKNKTGFDLVGLFCGSEGELGVITEATVRIIPHLPSRGMLAAVFPEFSIAAETVQTILNSGHLPSALEITDTFTLNAARNYLGESAFPPGKAHLIIEIDGRISSVLEELDELTSLLESKGAAKVDRAETDEECEAIWQLRREFSYSLKNTGMTKLNEDIVVPRSKLVDLVEFAKSLTDGDDIAVACFGHSGDGNIHTNIMVANYADPVIRRKADQAVDTIFKWVLRNNGSITGEHGIGLAKAAWIDQALDANNLLVHRKIKQVLDPNNTLNPGKMGL